MFIKTGPAIPQLGSSRSHVAEHRSPLSSTRRYLEPSPRMGRTLTCPFRHLPVTGEQTRCIPHCPSLAYGKTRATNTSRIPLSRQSRRHLHPSGGRATTWTRRSRPAGCPAPAPAACAAPMLLAARTWRETSGRSSDTPRYQPGAGGFHAVVNVRVHTHNRAYQQRASTPRASRLLFRTDAREQQV